MSDITTYKSRATVRLTSELLPEQLCGRVIPPCPAPLVPCQGHCLPPCEHDEQRDAWCICQPQPCARQSLIIPGSEVSMTHGNKEYTLLDLDGPSQDALFIPMHLRTCVTIVFTGFPYIIKHNFAMRIKEIGEQDLTGCRTLYLSNNQNTEPIDIRASDNWVSGGSCVFQVSRHVYHGIMCTTLGVSAPEYYPNDALTNKCVPYTLTVDVTMSGFTPCPGYPIGLARCYLQLDGVYFTSRIWSLNTDILGRSCRATDFTAGGIEDIPPLGQLSPP